MALKPWAAAALPDRLNQGRLVTPDGPYSSRSAPLARHGDPQNGATPVCRERKIRFPRRSATNTKATQSGPREDQHTDNTNKTALPGTRRHYCYRPCRLNDRQRCGWAGLSHLAGDDGPGMTDRLVNGRSYRRRRSRWGHNGLR